MKDFNTQNMVAAIDTMKLKLNDLYRCDVLLVLAECFTETFSPLDGFEIPDTLIRLSVIQSTYKQKYARDIVGDIMFKLRTLTYLNNDLQVMNSAYELWYLIATEIARIESKISHSTENDIKDMTMLRAYLQCRYQVNTIIWHHGFNSALREHLNVWNITDSHDLQGSLKMGLYGDYEKHTMIMDTRAMNALSRLDTFQDLSGSEELIKKNGTLSFLPTLSGVIGEMCSYICYAKDTIKNIDSDRSCDEIDRNRCEVLERTGRDMSHTLDSLLSIQTTRG